MIGSVHRYSGKRGQGVRQTEQVNPQRHCGQPCDVLNDVDNAGTMRTCEALGAARKTNVLFSR